MPTIEELATMFCEDYSDQSGEDFKFLSFDTFSGGTHIEEIGSNLARQAHEIYRRFGKRTRIKLYK